jgi:hypothetical protein
MRGTSMDAKTGSMGCRPKSIATRCFTLAQGERADASSTAA